MVGRFTDIWPPGKPPNVSTKKTELEELVIVKGLNFGMDLSKYKLDRDWWFMIVDLWF